MVFCSRETSLLSIMLRRTTASDTGCMKTQQWFCSLFLVTHHTERYAEQILSLACLSIITSLFRRAALCKHGRAVIYHETGSWTPLLHSPKIAALDPILVPGTVG
ncbi:hypothetical protein SISSUDRAFT_784616 [Sistotremastrum suecicum HHB10207 ss-3]|uniref:Uncharacterized protein n=1 Tax=Sistotremastrum suecicum HHB10207 ss-3 TaxID=1314776 RepID=A0A166D2V6_9AGAM|nr:hypothetical protein SISSUDRAFT_784616 [Sistotremastrum suecicum HHB10207 ss-3]